MKPMPLRLLSLVLALIAGVDVTAAHAADTATARLHINLRQAPDLGSTIVAALQTGDRVEVLETRGEFVKVRKTSGSKGFVKSKYLTMTSEAPTIATTPPAAAPPPTPTPVASTLPASTRGGDAAPVVTPAPASAPATAPATPAQAVKDSGAPVAPVASPASPSPRGWYVRGMGGVGFASESPHSIQRELNGAGGTVTLRKLDLSVPVFGVDVGYRLTSHWSVEGGVLDLGAYQGVVQASGADLGKVKDVLSRHYPGGRLGSDFLVGAQQDVDRWTFGVGAGGFCSFDPQQTFNLGASSVTVDYEPCAPLFSGRIENSLNPHLAVGLLANAVFFEDRQFTLGLSLRYR